MSLRRPFLPLSLVGLLALSTAACSSTQDNFDPGLGPDGGYGTSGGGSGSGGADEDGATDEGGDSSGGGEDGSNELPPEPDDDGVDNASDGTEVCDSERNVALYLSPDDSNSMSSPVQVREAVLSDWGGVQSVAIRTWEFFNYYSFDYPDAPEGTLVVTPSLLQPAEADDGEFLLQVGVSSERVTDETRAPINLTLVLDTSGSMAGDAMDALTESCRAIAASLRAGDTISIVTWSTDDSLVLSGYEVTGPDDPIVLAEIEGLEAQGGSDLQRGLAQGYELAQGLFDPSAINRIVLVSDGGANAAIADIDLIAEYSGSEGEHGIYLVGVGVGDALSYHDDLMDTVTDAGKGASVFIGSADEAWSVLHDDFISTMGVAARDLQVRLELPPGFEIVQSLDPELDAGGSAIEPQHLAPNDAMVFHQRIRTCAPELLDQSTTMTVAVSYLDASSFEPREVELTLPLAELLQADPAPLLKGAAIFTYAESLKAYKRANAEGRVSTMAKAFGALELAEAALPEDPELAEIRAVLEALGEGY